MRADGELRWFRSQGTVVRDDEGHVVAIRGSNQDITERKLVEEALRQRERQLADAQRVARLGSWEQDLRTGRITWSDEMYRPWG